MCGCTGPVLELFDMHASDGRRLSFFAILASGLAACFGSSSGGTGPGAQFDAGIDGAAFDGTAAQDTGAPAEDSATGTTDAGASLDASSDAPPEAGPFDLGVAWHEIEENGNCHGLWTRQGTTNVFSSVWADCGGTTATITITVAGTTVTAQRTMDSGGNDCTYTGTLDASGTSVTGTYTCMLYMPPPPGAWSATIDLGGDAGADGSTDGAVGD
jgi:hypothetical protein